VSPSEQATVTSAPSCSVSVASPQPTTAGMPSSRAMMAAWQVRPPRLVTMALARFITGSQLGSVMSVTSTSPGCTRSISAVLRTRRTGPGADLLADGAAFGQHRVLLRSPLSL
jgi:hypothetical protein